MVEKRVLALSGKPPFLVKLHSCFQSVVSFSVNTVTPSLVNNDVRADEAIRQTITSFTFQDRLYFVMEFVNGGKERVQRAIRKTNNATSDYQET